ncbi:MAG: hypothetical protein IKD69_00985 [Solobacterium sp.]|nr:hypothetical protein [Solobacterium sp.]
MYALFPLIPMILTGLVIILVLISSIARISSQNWSVSRGQRGYTKDFIPQDADMDHPASHASDNLNGVRGGVIRHDDPEPGYVVLNGRKRRISDCKNL